MGYAHGTRWTDDKIKSEILNVKNALCIDRMPTRSECIKVLGNSSLTNAVAKRYGWYELAKTMGLEIKDSETTTGKRIEEQVCKMLKHRGHRVKRMSQNFPYDLLVENCVKVDVKGSRLYRGKLGDFYTFNLEKNCATCDFYILVLLDDDCNILQTLVVPSCHVMFNTQISVGAKNSKYYIYTDKWELIREASDFWESVTA